MRRQCAHLLPQHLDLPLVFLSIKASAGKLLDHFLFLASRTRPDISVAVGLSDLNSSDMVAAKRVLRYLCGTVEYALFISARKENLEAYADADWGGDTTDRKSTSDSLLMLGGTSIPWKSAKQKLVALSTSEAEFISASDTCRHIL